MDNERLTAYLKAMRKACLGIEEARMQNLDILLEYSEEQGMFHFNFVDKKTWLGKEEPSPFYVPLGYTKSEDYQLFLNFCDSRGMVFNAPLSGVRGVKAPSYKEVEAAFEEYRHGKVHEMNNELEDYKKKEILLEFFEKGNHFHYNTGNYVPDECYRALGYCTYGEADVFCELMQPLLSNAKYGEIKVTFESMQQAWEKFREMLEKGKIALP